MNAIIATSEVLGTMGLSGVFAALGLTSVAVSLLSKFETLGTLNEADIYRRAILAVNVEKPKLLERSFISQRMVNVPLGKVRRSLEQRLGDFLPPMGPVAALELRDRYRELVEAIALEFSETRRIFLKNRVLVDSKQSDGRFSQGFGRGIATAKVIGRAEALMPQYNCPGFTVHQG